MDTTIEQSEIYFEDGNIILLTQGEPKVAFKVHRGVLARHSAIFRDMLEISKPVDNLGGIFSDGCPVVPMYDDPAELASFIKALYDGPAFKNESLTDFFHLAGILRLSTKYVIENFRSQAIEQLTKSWPNTLAGHDAMVHVALKTQPVEGLTYPFAHPLHVLNLARSVNVGVVIPAAFYFLSIYRLDELLKADHRKLNVEHPSRPSSQLSNEDIINYTLIFQYRLDVIFDFIRNFCVKFTFRNCKMEEGPNPCKNRLLKLTSMFGKSWMLRTGPLHFMMQVIHEVDADTVMCESCKSEFRSETHALRQKTWLELPAIVRMPEWGVLESDLSL